MEQTALLKACRGGNASAVKIWLRCGSQLVNPKIIVNLVHFRLEIAVLFFELGYYISPSQLYLRDEDLVR